MTERELVDLMRAADGLEAIFRKVFQDFAPLYDEDENAMRRALAVIHELIREYNQ